jgi:hypothetical protein
MWGPILVSSFENLVQSCLLDVPLLDKNGLQGPNTDVDVGQRRVLVVAS